MNLFESRFHQSRKHTLFFITRSVGGSSQWKWCFMGSLDVEVDGFSVVCFLCESEEPSPVSWAKISPKETPPERSSWGSVGMDRHPQPYARPLCEASGLSWSRSTVRRSDTDVFRSGKGQIWLMSKAQTWTSPHDSPGSVKVLALSVIMTIQQNPMSLKSGSI